MSLAKGTNCGFVATAPAGDPGDSAVAMDNRARALQDTAPISGNIIEIGWYAVDARDDVNYEVALYDDDSDTKPGNQLNIDATNAKGTSAGWKSVTVSWPIVKDTLYWLAVQLDNTTPTTGIRTVSDAGEKDSSIAVVSTLVDPWFAGSAEATNLVSIYAVYKGVARGKVNRTLANRTPLTGGLVA